MFDTVMPTRRDLLRGVGALAAPVLCPPAWAQIPAASLAGVIRVCGSRQMGELMAIWVRAFTRMHPAMRFEIDLKGTATAQFGLQSGTADLALSGREAPDYEQYGIFRRSQLITRKIAVATGSYDRIGQSAALAVLVHPDNPISGLTVDELDRMFGAERAGGWGTMAWNKDVARGPGSNIRVWGQLGLTGEWANAPIIPYAPPAAHPGGISFFQRRVMQGADSVNEKTREYADRHQMVDALKRDRFGIGYASLGYAKGAALRVLPLAAGTSHRFVPMTSGSVANGSYPLTRYAYIYAAPDTPSGDETPLSPNLRAFLAFVLDEGQQLIAPTGYFRLPPAMVRDQRSRLDSAAETQADGD